MSDDQQTIDSSVSNEPPPSQDPATPTMETPAALGPGVEIGHYRIVRKIGEGGMGVVYEAEQQRPHRRVALKVIHPGVATGPMLRRFEHEVEVLGRLRHRGIAQIYEAGMFHTAAGAQPFFAMEYVDGMWLTEFVKTENPTLHQRIQLIIQICDAVHHAHQKGVIHRDLKPANIIVDKEGQPKILDFGVARATNGDLQTATMQTDVGQLLGTVPYMSPEQARGMPDDLDTRSDVYALGVVCYELLAGQLPYDIHRRMIHEAVRVIQEQDPTPLSSIDLHLRGDVETIIKKALEKDKARRYQSSSELAADFQRFLNYEPITARPPSVWYQLTKFSRRNRTLVGGATGVTLALAAGLAVSTTLYFAAERARQAEFIARHQAETAAEVNRQVNKFLVEDLLLSARPERSLGRAITVREILANASRGLESGRFAQQPLVEAAVREAVGNSYRAIGEYEPALWHLEQAAGLARSRLGVQHERTQGIMNDVAAVTWLQGRYERAEGVWRDLLRIRRRQFGAEHPSVLAVRLNLSLLAMDRAPAEDVGQSAYAQVRSAAADCARRLGPTHPMTMVAMKRLVDADIRQGHLGAAQDKLESLLSQELGSKSDAHPDVLVAAHQLVELRHRRGEARDSEPMLRAIHSAMRKVLGEAHPDTLEARLSIGRLFLDRGRVDAARPIISDVLARRRTALGPTHPATVSAMSDLAAVHQAAGRYAEAARIWGKVLDHRRAAGGRDAPASLSAMVDLASAQRAMGDYARARESLAEALETQRRTLGESHPDTIATRNNLASLYWVLGEYEKARTHAERAVEQYRQVFGPSHRHTLLAMNNLTLIYQATCRYGAAGNAWRVGIQLASAAHGEEDWLTGLLKNNLGWLLRDVGRFDAAAATIEPVLRQYAEQFGRQHPRTLAIQSNLAMARLGQKRLAEAQHRLEHVLQQRREQFGDDHVDTATAAYRLSLVLAEAGKTERARALCTEALITRDRVLGKHHPETLKAINQLARIALETGDTDTAASWVKRFSDLDSPGSQTGRWIGERVLTQALYMRASGEQEQAITTFKRAHGILDDYLDPSHPRLVEAEKHLKSLGSLN